jgi:Na+-driven multidrug efflux pump
LKFKAKGTASEALTRTAWASVLLAALGPVFMACFYLVVAPLTLGVGKSQELKEVAYVLVGVAFVAVPLLTLTTGIVALFQSNNPKWVPAITTGCGCLPLMLLALLMVFIIVTGGV